MFIILWLNSLREYLHMYYIRVKEFRRQGRHYLTTEMDIPYARKYRIVEEFYKNVSRTKMIMS